MVDNNSETCSLLLDLPIISKDAFKNFNGACGPEVFREYISQQEDIGPETIKIQPPTSPNLVRIIFGNTKIQNKRKEFSTDRVTQPYKRPKWSDMDRDRKQSCLRLAVSAAAKYAQPGDRVHKLHTAWTQNPRKKQVIDLDVRRALCSQLKQWSINELKDYLKRAGIQGLVHMTKNDLRTAIMEHMGVLNRN